MRNLTSKVIDSQTIRMCHGHVGVVMSSAPPPSPPPPPEVVVVGDRAKQLLETAPFSLTVDFNVVEATANLDKRTG